MISIFRIIQIFSITFIYLIQLIYQKALHRKVDIVLLKKIWADEILKKLGFTLSIYGSCATDQKLICIGNHISFIDILVLISANPYTSFVAKKEVSYWPIIGWGAKQIHTIFVDRGNQKSKLFAREKIANHIKHEELPHDEKRHITIFPSGTTSLFEELPWKKGAFQIAQNTNVKIQPFRITYEPLGECSYIDDDNLISKMFLLLKTSNKKVHLEWGKAKYVSEPNNLNTEIESIRRWTSYPVRTEVNPILHLVLS